MSILDDYKPRSLDEILQGSKFSTRSKNILLRAQEKISSNSKTIEEMVKDSEERKKKALAEIEAQKAEIPAKVAKKVAEIFKNY